MCTEPGSCAKEKQSASFEEALDITGSGVYNVALLGSSSLILLAAGIDLFGVSFIVSSSACDLETTLQQQGLISSLPFIGIILVSYFWGYFADTRGRRRTLLWSMYGSFVLSSLGSLSPHWIVLALVKFLSVCFSCAANAATFTLLGECCPLRIRGRYMLMSSVLLMFAVGLSALMALPVLALDFTHPVPWLGISFRPWRLLIVVLALPCGLGALSMHFFHESPKFLVHCGRNDEAVEVLQKIYSINNPDSRDQYPVKTLILQDEAMIKSKDQTQSLLRSMWEQTVPLFRPPLLTITLQLSYLMAVTYTTNNSFVMWFPKIFNSLFSSMGSRNDTAMSMCSLITPGVPAYEFIETREVVCVDNISESTVWTVVIHGAAITLLCLVVAQLNTWKKSVLVTCFAASTFSAISINHMPEPISSVIMFTVFTAPCLGLGILSSYFVELYPTAYRGMAACLGMMAARLTAFIGINVVGNVIFTHCHLTFYIWSALVFSAVVVAYFLPSGGPLKKDSKETL